MNTYEHLIKRAQMPKTAKTNQDQFNRERLERVQRAISMRPQFLPVRHNLPNVAATTPHAKNTDELLHDCIVWGAITDGENRKAKLYKDLDALPLVRTGSEPGANLTLDAIAGKNVAAAGKAGVFEYPEPYRLDAGQVLTLELFQEEATAAIVSTVFCGTRALSLGAEEAQLTPDWLNEVENAINTRPNPETKFSMFPVKFTNGEATAQTPKADEPILILGFRSTVTNALCNFGYDTDKGFSKSMFPIWALASEQDNAQTKFQMLKEPLFVPKGQQLSFWFKQSIDGVLFAENGQIEMILSTM